MFRSAVLFCIVLLTLCRAALAQQPRLDSITESFYPPELLVHHAQEVGLDDEQKQFIESKVRENRMHYAELQQNLQRQMAGLAELLRQDHPDEQSALDQLDKVLAAERDIKRAQLSLALVIRSKLTPEQQAKAKELRQKYAGETRPIESVRAKMQQLQERIRRLQESGKDPSAAQSAVQECKQLMQDGKPREAEAALDRALAAAAAADTDGKKQ